MTSGWRSRISRIFVVDRHRRPPARSSAASTRGSTDCLPRAPAGTRCRAATPASAAMSNRNAAPIATMVRRWRATSAAPACKSRRSARTTMVSVSSTCSGSRNEASTGVTVKVASKRPDQREAVGSRHRTEDLAFDALHGEQRNERRDRDRGGKEDRLVDLQRAGQDHPQPIGPAAAPPDRRSWSDRRPSVPRRAARSSRCRSAGLAWKFRKMFSTRITAESTMMPKSTAPTDSRLASSPGQHQDDDGEEQRERNVDADDDGAAQIAEKDPLDEKDQQTAEDEIVQDRVVVTVTSVVRS